MTISAHDPFLGPQVGPYVDPEPTRSLMRTWGYVQEPLTAQQSGYILPVQSRPSTTVRPIDIVLLIAGHDNPEQIGPLKQLATGDVLVVELATLVSYPDGPGPVVPGLMHARCRLFPDEEKKEKVRRAMTGLEPEVRLKGSILPAEEPAAIGPVPHVLRSGNELRFTMRCWAYKEGNWPPMTLPVRYKGPKADHIYSRITDPERAAVDVVGKLKAEPDGALRVQASSIVGARVLVAPQGNEKAEGTKP